MRPVLTALACLLLGGCVVYPDGSLGPVPAPGVPIPAPVPPVAYAPPVYGHGYDVPYQGVPTYVVPAPAPPPVVVAPAVGIGVGLGWGRGYWGPRPGGYWGRPYYRRW
ncbi:hypothetical protein [Roseomonas sp. CECT 9278]|uniref:hypothetical protein n=1 Tax=Roseomonas sp. CECT 9278 TaxID=2845823 RepID=UPI001E427288|nr:hypothetical protein [Roseomonas sp. CECT 9278]CAH0204474.1 hypothetical protein ROS9278_02005 [Roseomonas sp. CECT 9278]